jgi:hypothetical protein
MNRENKILNKEGFNLKSLTFPRDSLVVASLVSLLALNIVDYLITVYGLSLGATEANPLFNMGFGLIIPKILVFLAVVLVVGNYLVGRKYNLKYVRVFSLLCLLGLNFFYVYIMVHNALQLL